MTEWYILGWTFIGMLIVLALLFGILGYERRN
jgi:hypothetical protein